MILRSIGTHDGPFHSDEVAVCALLLLFDLIDRDKIIRTRNEEKLAQCEYVCDVGGIYDPAKKRFDHHQLEYQGDLSSAGMILLFLKEKKIIDEAQYHFFNNSLIIGIDADDNGKIETQIGHCSFSDVIVNFMPPFHDAPPEEITKSFFKALDFTFGHLQRLLIRFKYIKECKKEVEEAMLERKECLFFDRSMPWQDSFFELGGETHPALFLIMPAGKHWKLRGIPPSRDRLMQVRMPLPEDWAGLHEDALKRVSGIKGAIFCHKGLFISIWETKEDALEALNIVLKQGEIR